MAEQNISTLARLEEALHVAETFRRHWWQRAINPSLNRDMRMAAAEKKAAALPPKLTVPMILFFLPVLFIVILGPAAIKMMQQDIFK